MSRAVLLIGTGLTASCGSGDTCPDDCTADAAYGGAPVDVHHQDAPNDAPVIDASDAASDATTTDAADD